MKTLSLCIPTYNRAKILDCFLGSLLEERAGLENEVEICISDNCSTDETQAVLRKWKDRLPIVYSRNDSNLGYDRNVLKVTSLASGEYIWYLGDDDRLTKGAVKKLVQDLKKYTSSEMKVVYINAMLRNKWITKCNFENFSVFNKKHMPLRPNVSFAGSICANREIVLKVVSSVEVRDGMLYKTEYKNFLLHDFIHTYIFMECLKHSQVIGVAPNYGVEIMADGGSISYKKKLHLELTITKYILEIKKYYPWFNEAELIVDSKIRVIGRTFINSAMACEEPELEPGYRAFVESVVRILELENRGMELMIIKIYEKVRRIPLVKFVIIAIFRIMRVFRKMPFEKKEDNDMVLERNRRHTLKHLDETLH